MRLFCPQLVDSWGVAKRHFTRRGVYGRATGARTRSRERDRVSSFSPRRREGHEGKTQRIRPGKRSSRLPNRVRVSNDSSNVRTAVVMGETSRRQMHISQFPILPKGRRGGKAGNKPSCRATIIAQTAQPIDPAGARRSNFGDSMFTLAQSCGHRATQGTHR